MRYLLFSLVLFIAFSAYPQEFDYKNPELPTDQRVSDLLSRMTLEEKVAQLLSAHPRKPKLDDAFLNNPEEMKSYYGNGMGMMNPQFSGALEETVKLRNKIQNYMLTQTRLGIPIIFLDEGHHGLMRKGANVFPQAIGLACSWDPELAENVYSYIANEVSSWGTNMVLTPVVDVCRDPRWGRTGETFGEDPYLCGVMGAALVKGFQGSSNGEILPNHVAATLKHFAAYGEPDGGINQSTGNFPERVLREIHMKSFQYCFENAKPAAVMASYNEIDGIPSHGSKWLLKDVLREEWKFDGVVVSDWYGVDQLWNKHYVAKSAKEAAFQAFTAGVTIDLPYGTNFKFLTELVNEGRLELSDLDFAVSKILELKFKLGLFETGVINPQDAIRVSANPIADSLALVAAEKSIVLLKNENNILPLKINALNKIAVIGPCANQNYYGDYSGVPKEFVTIYDGIKQKVGNNCEVVYSEGCRITTNGSDSSLNNFQFINEVKFPSKEDNLKLIKAALEVAESSDVIIVAIGENEQLCREAWLPNHFGDNSTLDLLSDQEELVKSLYETGKPVIVYLMHARPLILNWIADHVPVIVDGWYMGQQTGNAFANILFGETCPSGKLTISYPRSVGQLPVYYNHKPSARYFDYVSEQAKPLFPFGFGLSYVDFIYSDLKTTDSIMNTSETIMVSVEVTNAGDYTADEIVQLYIRDKVSSVTRPVKELKNFKRITLKPGEAKEVSFTVNAETFRFWDINMNYTCEPGMFELYIGSSSIDENQKIEIQYIN